eukprot:TRINITY_DN10487_c0_g2_i7.p1 TRINITY_DN10487_c0_g2~~TRINITY_DN10487_c0_g2_i7.p1  ORF type:complete len:101 (-),score=11.87 TRINITY_DN10487_c0_g2_i7:142-444(-)
MLSGLDELCPRRQDVPSTHQLTAHLLTLLDGIDQRPFLVIGIADNRHAVDEALRRSGRLDAEVGILPPSELERAGLLELMLSKIPTQDNLDLHKLSLIHI